MRRPVGDGESHEQECRPGKRARAASGRHAGAVRVGMTLHDFHLSETADEGGTKARAMPSEIIVLILVLYTEEAAHAGWTTVVVRGAFCR